MKKLIIFWTILIFSCLSLAAENSELKKVVLEAQPKCANMVRFDESRLFLGFGWYRNALEEPRSPIPGRIRVVRLQDQEAFDLRTNDAALDVISEGDMAYVLTYSAIEKWDLKNRLLVNTYATYAISRTLSYKEHAEAFARYKSKLIIAQGRLGVSFFDLDKKRVTNQYRLIPGQLPLESMATAVTVQGNLAYVVMDSFHATRPGDGVKIFRGLVVINMDTESIVAELNGMDPGADGVTADAGKVIVSFWGMPIWKYNRHGLNGNHIPEPEVRVWKFPFGGHPTGFAEMDDKYYYTCFFKPPSYPGENSGYSKKIPIALDRRVLMLD